jgi:hypothetical protein
MLFSCEGMRQGRHHLFDGVDTEQAALQNTFKHQKHTRIEAAGTLSKQQAGLLAEEFEDIHDEDFDE